MAVMGMSGKMDETVGDMQSRRVIVVGAGVSGCACAAALSMGGISVTLLNPALDHVCEPSFGPELKDGGHGGERLWRVLGLAPEGIRKAWQEAMLSSGDSSVSVLDRRLASVRTKQALENMEGIELRQGLVVGLEVSAEAVGSDWQRNVGDEDMAAVSEAPGTVAGAEGAAWGVKVQTVFAEEVEADAVVVAVGLSLGGSLAVGENDFGTGYYGQPAAEGLETCLRALGGEMKSASVDVGACRVAADFELDEAAAKRLTEASEGKGSGSGWRFAIIGMERVGDAGSHEGREGPPSPYDEVQLWTKHALVADRGEDGPAAVALPDGVATGEVALAAERSGVVVKGRASERNENGFAWLSGGQGTVSRPACSVSGRVIDNLGENGRLRNPSGDLMPVWVTGRSAGARDYLESLEMGLRTGEAVACALRSGVSDGR